MRILRQLLSKRFTALTKISLVIIWIVLFGLLLERDYLVKSPQVGEEAEVLARAREESFLGVHFQDERIGFVRNRFSNTEKGGIHLDQEAHLVLNILDRKYPVELKGEALLTSGYLLRSFSFRLNSTFYRSTIEGEVKGENLYLQISTGKDTINRTLHLDSRPFISTNRRGYLLTGSLEEGDRIRVPYFDPFSLSLQNTTIIYQGREKVVINGRVRNLHRFQETFAGIRVSSWLNDKGDVVKEESPAGFTFVSEPEFRARDIRGADKELLSSVSAPLIKGKMPNLGSRSRIRYLLHLPESGDFDLQGGRQSFTGPSGSNGKADHETSVKSDTGVLTIEKEAVPEQEALFCTNKKEYLQATPYIQADHQEIKTQAQEIVSREEPPLSQVRSLTEWVYKYLDKKPVIGIPDAVTTLAGGRGDCNEHAVLFAALARSAGIPARIAAGVAFTVPSASYGKGDEELSAKNGAFYYHAWNEVCLDGRWLSLDSTRNQVPADLGHIKFIQGNLEGQVRIGSLLGKLKVEVLD